MLSQVVPAVLVVLHRGGEIIWVVQAGEPEGTGTTRLYGRYLLMSPIAL